MSITAADIRAWIGDFADVIAENRMELVRLDTAIGDGDHGTNMDRGMKAAVEKLEATEGDEVLAFVNGMGGTPLIELYIVYNELNKFLQARGIKITRNLIGNYITSLEMAGCSITLVRLDDELTRLWDAPVDTIALRWGAR